MYFGAQLLDVYMFIIVTISSWWIYPFVGININIFLSLITFFTVYFVSYYYGFPMVAVCMEYLLPPSYFEHLCIFEFNVYVLRPRIVEYSWSLFFSLVFFLINLTVSPFCLDCLVCSHLMLFLIRLDICTPFCILFSTCVMYFSHLFLYCFAVREYFFM